MEFLAQEHYVTEKEVHEELAAEAMELWRAASEDYRTKVPRYREKLQRKRELKLRLDKMPERVLAEFPVIEFFEIDEEPAAEGFANEATVAGLLYLLQQIEELKTDYVFQTLTSWLVDAEYLIARREHPKQGCSMAIGTQRVGGWPFARSGIRAYHYMSYRD